MNINYLSPINNLGYGYSGFYILKHLIQQGHNPSLFPIGGVEVDNQNGIEYVKQAKKQAQFYDKNAPSLRLYHQFALDQHVGKGLHVGFPIFELNRFNKIERHHIESQDKVFVCSEWAKRIVEEQTSQNNISVIPLGFDQELIADMIHPIFRRDDRTECVFLNIGKWEIRKGHAELIKAFNDAFNVDDKVELWVVAENVFYSKEENDWWNKEYTQSKMGKACKVRILPRMKTHAEIIGLMNVCDVGVWPAKAEGWNMELHEMMALGKPIIATNYSGHTEFCDKGNSYLIPIEKLEPAIDNKWFHGQGEWASLIGRPYEHLVETMRTIYRSNLYLEKNNEGVMTGKRYSWKNTVDSIIRGLI